MKYKTFYRLAVIVLGLFLSLGLSACSQTGDGSLSAPFEFIKADDSKKQELAIDRIKDLEQRIDILERDFRAVEPDIQNLIAIENDIEELITELAKLTDGAPAPVPMTEATPEELTDSDEDAPFLNEDDFASPIPEEASPPSDAQDQPTSLLAENTSQEPPPTEQAKPPETKTPKQASLGYPHQILDVRFGIYEGATRIVIDFAADSDIEYDIAKDGSDILIAFSKTEWLAEKQWKSDKYNLINGYEITQTAEESMMTIKTNGADMTVKVFTLPAANNGKGPRLVLDFAKGVNS